MPTRTRLRFTSPMAGMVLDGLAQAGTGRRGSALTPSFRGMDSSIARSAGASIHLCGCIVLHFTDTETTITISRARFPVRSAGSAPRPALFTVPDFTAALFAPLTAVCRQAENFTRIERRGLPVRLFPQVGTWAVSMPGE